MSPWPATTFPPAATDVRTAFFIAGFIIIQASLVDGSEYCLSDVFNATCGEEEVVVMTSALHGRMRSGRCIRMEYDKERCQRDIIRYVDGICSGRRSCSFQVATLREVAQVCHSDLSTYLEASYRCHKVSSEKCFSPFHRPSFDQPKDERPPSPSEASLILPTFAGTNRPSNRVGSESCPWQIVVDQRQRIRFVLYSFSADDGSGAKGFPPPPHPPPPPHSSSHHPACSASLIFEENSHVTHEKLCRGSPSRKWIVFTSNWNSVAVHVRTDQFYERAIFLLQYEAIGCPGIKAPAGATVSYERNSATIRCNATGDSSELNCEGTLWFGEIINCSEVVRTETMARDGHPLLSFSYLPYGLATAVTIGVLLGIVVGSVPLGLAYVFLKRKWQKTSKDLLQSDAYDMQSRKIDSDDQTCPQVFFHNPQQSADVECECYGPSHPHLHPHHQHHYHHHPPPPPPQHQQTSASNPQAKNPLADMTTTTMMMMMVPDEAPRSDFPDLGMRRVLMHVPMKQQQYEQTQTSRVQTEKPDHPSTPSRDEPKLTSIDTTGVFLDVQMTPTGVHPVSVNRERHHQQHHQQQQHHHHRSDF